MGLIKYKKKAARYTNFLPNLNSMLLSNLKKFKLEHLYNPKEKYHEYFCVAINSTLKNRNVSFLVKEDLHGLIYEAIAYVFSKPVLLKFVSVATDESGLHRYLGKTLEYRLQYLITLAQNNNKKPYEVDNEFIENMPSIGPGQGFNTDYKFLIKNIKEYLSKRTKQADLLTQLFIELLNGLSINEIAKKLNIGQRYAYKMHDELVKQLKMYSTTTKNKDLGYLLNERFKKSTEEFSVSPIFEIFESLKASKKTAKLISIRKLKDKLSKSYFIDNTLNPNISSSQLKQSIQNYLDSFTDDTDVIDEDGSIYAIKCVK